MKQFLRPLVLTATLSACVASAASCTGDEAELGRVNPEPVLPEIAFDSLVEDVDEEVVLRLLDVSECPRAAFELSFEEPDEYVIQELFLESGSEVTIETTGALAFDSLVALYRPTELGVSTNPAVVADSGGPGLHASLDRYTIDQSGDWLVVITSWNGGSKGTLEVEIQVDDRSLCDYLNDEDGGEACCLEFVGVTAAFDLENYVYRTEPECVAGGGEPLAVEWCEYEEVCCLVTGYVAPLDWRHCDLAGGEPMKDAVCFEYNQADEEVCCAFPGLLTPSNLAQCVEAAGLPGDLEECPREGDDG